MSSYLVVQLYCTAVQADSVRAAATAELTKYTEFGQTQVGLKQEAETDYEMHLNWAREHPGQDSGDRAYYLLEMTSPVDIPESLLREAEDNITDWIGSTYNDNDNVEVPWASRAGTTLQA
ncbi:hypothetical protein [Nocardia carnea]|uniref:Uncharacterized protein n=1 Tax=Nocardia carnea TaxID=37328 RepID=A0ABW7TSM8_9NOCA|nr:hypothetical protein [Nocardia carnea]